MIADNNTAVDYDDVTKLANTNENVGIKKGADVLAIEYRDIIHSDADTVFLNMANTRLKNYQWKFILEDMDAPGRTGYLVDQFFGSQTALNLTGETTYDFTVTNAAGSWAADRFYIVFKPAAVVPVRFTAVTAERQKDKTVLVNWKTENEINIHHYEVQRSGNGIDFISIGSKAPSNNNGGNAQYDLTDEHASANENYYRIKAISNNGHVDYSAIAKVSAIGSERGMGVVPNPVTHKAIHLLLTNQPKGKYSLEIINEAGQVIYKGTITVDNVVETKNISLPKSASAGEYSLILVDEKGERNAMRVTLL